MFRPYVSEHLGVDHAETLHDTQNVGLFGTAYEIPTADATFDTALAPPCSSASGRAEALCGRAIGCSR